MGFISVTLGLLLYFIALYNVSKIPWYLGWIKTPDYGLEASITVSLIGFRSRKLIAHPTLFLAPHALMGAALLTLYGSYLIFGYSKSIGNAFFAMGVIFALHAIPERNGVPNRYAQKPINEAAIVVLLAGCAIGYFAGKPQMGMSIGLLPLLFAAGLEARKPLPFCIQKALGKEVHAASLDGDQPLPRNKQGYSSCPCAKFFDIDDAPYAYSQIE